MKGRAALVGVAVVVIGIWSWPRSVDVETADNAITSSDEAPTKGEAPAPRAETADNTWAATEQEHLSDLASRLGFSRSSCEVPPEIADGYLSNWDRHQRASGTVVNRHASFVMPGSPDELNLYLVKPVGMTAGIASRFTAYRVGPNDWVCDLVGGPLQVVYHLEKGPEECQGQVGTVRVSTQLLDLPNCTGTVETTIWETDPGLRSGFATPRQISFRTQAGETTSHRLTAQCDESGPQDKPIWTCKLSMAERSPAAGLRESRVELEEVLLDQAAVDCKDHACVEKALLGGMYLSKDLFTPAPEMPTSLDGAEPRVLHLWYSLTSQTSLHGRMSFFRDLASAEEAMAARGYAPSDEWLSMVAELETDMAAHRALHELWGGEAWFDERFDWQAE